MMPLKLWRLRISRGGGGGGGGLLHGIPQNHSAAPVAVNLTIMHSVALVAVNLTPVIWLIIHRSSRKTGTVPRTKQERFENNTVMHLGKLTVSINSNCLHILLREISIKHLPKYVTNSISLSYIVISFYCRHSEYVGLAPYSNIFYFARKCRCRYIFP